MEPYQISISELNVQQIAVSKNLLHFESRVKSVYNLQEYVDSEQPCIFFGFYNQDDWIRIQNHHSIRYVLWGGGDVNNLTNIKRMKLGNRLRHLAISDNIQTRLTNHGLVSKRLSFNLVDKLLFLPVVKPGTAIYIYNGYSNDTQETTYGKKVYQQVIQRLPNYSYIFSNQLKKSYQDMPPVYTKCFIGLRLCQTDGNANTVQELEAMGIPVVHNHSKYGLKWNTVDDVVKHILTYCPQKKREQQVEYDNMITSNLNKFGDSITDDQSINFMDTNQISNDLLTKIYTNISNFNQHLHLYKCILFISTDYPGWGGAATNCERMIRFYGKTHQTYGIFAIFPNDPQIPSQRETGHYKIVDLNLLEPTLHALAIKPDLVILRNAINLDLRKIFTCPIYFMVAGIYKNILDIHYSKTLMSNDNQYINMMVIKQISWSHVVFCNSSHTKDILQDNYNIHCELLYFNFLPFHNKLIERDPEFDKRKYEYGVIVSNFNRPIKNTKMTVKSLIGNKDVILIGKNSKQYAQEGWTCCDLVDSEQMGEYYKNIKYVVQNSHYESCSNVMVEANFHGCQVIRKIKPFKKKVLIISTQYPGCGGAATNSYNIHRYLLLNQYDSYCLFLDQHNITVNQYNPDKLIDVYFCQTITYNYETMIYNIRSSSKLGVLLSNTYDVILAKNMMSPYIGRVLFPTAKINYLVSGINQCNNLTNPACDLLRDNIELPKIPKETASIQASDTIIFNSQLSLDLFNHIYRKDHKYQTSIVNTTLINNFEPIHDTNELISHQKYDFIIACSNLNRICKNNNFLASLCSNIKFQKYNIAVVGEEPSSFNSLSNCTCFGGLSHRATLEKMQLSKVLLFPSFYDSNPNTVYEAYLSKCLVLLTNNVGTADKFPEISVCGSFDTEEWTQKALYLVDNYDKVIPTYNVNFGEFNLDELV